MKNLFGIAGSKGPVVMVVAKGELLIVTDMVCPGAYDVASITLISADCTHVRMMQDVIVVMRGYLHDTAVCRELVMVKAHEPMDEGALREELSQYGVRLHDVSESDMLALGNRAESCVTTRAN